MRKGITIEVSAAVCARLEAVGADRNSPQKHVWRAGIILATADGLGTAEIMRRTGKSKPCVWRWQARFMTDGLDGLLRDKTRPSRVPPLGPEVAERVVSLTLTDPPAEFIRFLNAIEAAVPASRQVHAILDNYAVHKHPKVRAWLDRHPRWTFHFVPTSCSWLNAVEGFFAKLTRRRLKHGVFQSVVDLQAAINRFTKEHNRQPRPFVWRADPNQIIAAVRRGHQTLESIH